MIAYTSMLSDEEREFCGWFWGEGSYHIKKVVSPNSKSKKPYYQPSITVTQREDDPGTLRWCVNRFGGLLVRRSTVSPSMARNGYGANPRLTWQVAGFKRCKMVVEVLSQGKLPSKKRAELQIFKEFLSTYMGSGKVSTEQSLSLQAGLKQKLSEFKKYKPL